MPYALVYGMTEEEFWKSNPRKMKAHQKAYELRIKKQDEMNWYLGMYVQKAVLVAVEHCLCGKDAKSEYFKNPLMQPERESENRDPESNEIIAVIEMKKRIRLLEISGLPESPE